MNIANLFSSVSILQCAINLFLIQIPKHNVWSIFTLGNTSQQTNAKFEIWTEAKFLYFTTVLALIEFEKNLIIK